MTRAALCALAVACAPLAMARDARAEEGRFDVQTFRPSGAPQDLLMVSQSRVLSHMSGSIGFYFSYALDPLILLRAETRSKALELVRDRVTLDVMGSFGLFDWLDVGVAMPVILFQDGDNQEAVGTEGSVASSAFGDLRLTAKVAIPGLRRKAEGKGVGGALQFGLSLPTGNVEAFAGDGAVDFEGRAIFDYRFKGGTLIAANAGIWVRPERDFAGLKVGAQTPLGLALEVPIVRRWGINALGEAYGNISLTKLIDAPRQAPVEGLLGLRWYGSSGITITIAAGAGCTCAVGAPSFDFVFAMVWVPGKTREYAALERFKVPPPPDPDPDHDHVIGSADECPDKAGPLENHGCPDADRDGDKVVDRLDKCPDEPAGPHAVDGCPRARIVGNKIVIMDQVHFATDADVILPESFELLEDVAAIIRLHPEIQQLLVEGHTDVRASKAYNMDLSQRRAGSVMRFLIKHGIDPQRMHAQGFGREQPLADNATEGGMAQNRRVEFTIERTGARALLSAPPGGAQPGLPGAGSVLPTSKTLPTTNLPGQVLPNAPKGENTMPDARGSVLPSAGGSGPVSSSLPVKPSSLPTRKSPHGAAPAPLAPP